MTTKNENSENDSTKNIDKIRLAVLIDHLDRAMSAIQELEGMLYLRILTNRWLEDNQGDDDGE